MPNRIALLSFLLLAIATAGCGPRGEAAAPLAAAEPNEAERGKHGEFASRAVKVGDAVRQYRLVVPKTLDLTEPAPLVIALHGMLIDSKDLMPRYSRLNETAEKHHFLLAYPEAVGKSWGIAPEKVRNDLALFDALLEQIGSEYEVDPRRVYVLGLSNGGYFAHVVGRERSRRVAAVASHSGLLGLETLLGIHAARKFPVMIIHGDRDPIFPVELARENRDKYEREGHTVNYVELAGHGHLWADKAEINEKIWAFFAEHELPEE